MDEMRKYSDNNANHGNGQRGSDALGLELGLGGTEIEQNFQFTMSGADGQSEINML